MSTSPEPTWDDPELTALARLLREAHARCRALPTSVKPRLTRHLLLITDLAKRDPELAARRLKSFMSDLDRDQNVP